MRKSDKKFKLTIGDIILEHLEITDAKLVKRENRNDSYYRYYKYKCLKCGFDCGEHYKNGKLINEYWIEESNFIRTKGCICCGDGSTIVVSSINSINITSPNIVEYLYCKDDAYIYSRGMAIYVKCKCPKCGNVKKVILHNLTRDGFRCNECSDGISFPNKIMWGMLSELKIVFEREKRFDWCYFKNPFKTSQMTYGIYDFYIPSLKLIIEMDGNFGHGNKKSDKFNKINIDEQLFIDNTKNDLAKRNGVNIIRIDGSYKKMKDRFEVLVLNISNSTINDYLDLSKINWNNINEFTNKSICNEVCIYKSKNMDNNLKEISEIFGIYREYVINIQIVIMDISSIKNRNINKQI